jgi:hypothetical protein
MLQVPLGQPEIILRSVPLESHKILWSLFGPDQSMGDNVFHFELFLIIHQLWWGSLVRGSHLLWAGVIRFQVLHVLKWGQPSKSGWDFYSDSVGSSNL